MVATQVAPSGKEKLEAAAQKRLESPAVALLARTPLGDRMEFDPQLVVRLVWAGVPVVNVPTHVRYYRDGLSHFHPLLDNARISWAHTRLVFGMVGRLPRRAWRYRLAR